NWAVIGTDRKAVADMAKGISSDENYKYQVDEWSNTKDGYPEVSNNTPDSKGIVVDYDDNMNGKDKSEESALFTIHGAGHSSKTIKHSKSYEGSYGHLDQGVMQEGNELRKDYNKNGIGSILAPNQNKP